MMDMHARSNAIKKLIGAFALSLALITTSFSSLAAIPMAQLSSEQRRQTEAMLTQLLQRFVDQQERLDGQGKFVTVQVRLDPARGLDQAKGFIIIDLSTSYLPAERQELEDHTTDLAILARSKIKNSVIVHGIVFTYGGRDVYDYYPDEKPEPYHYEKLPPLPKQSQRKGASRLGTADDFVVVSAGHGKYLDFGKLGRGPQTWQWQRPDVSSGVLEDTNNSDFADSLRYWLGVRGNSVVTAVPRSTSTVIHEPSGEAWRNVAGRYYLESILPDNPEIWNFGGGASAKNRHYLQDINSRARFANHLDATAIISLHSNASKTLDPTVRGTEVIYHEGRGQDRLLGNSILCSMKEIIQAQEAYATFPVDTESLVRNNLAENSLVQNRLAIIVEVGYRTNPSDAAALLDPAFQEAAMKGVEKGYRLYREDTPCEPFEITGIADVSGPGNNTPIQIQVPYLGNPQFAVSAVVQVVTCPPGFTCGGGTVPFPNEVDSPLSYGYRCNNPTGQAVVIRLRTRLIDVDEVKTNPVEHNINCAGVPGGLNPSPTFTLDVWPIS